MRRVDQIFKNLFKPMEWLSFYNNDLPILMDIYKEVREASKQFLHERYILNRCNQQVRHHFKEKVEHFRGRLIS